MERKKLLFRGILNTAQYACLIHLDTFVGLMEAEGFARTDVEAMVDDGRQDGLRGADQDHLPLARRAPAKTFPFIPLYYYPHFVSMKSDNPEHLKDASAMRASS